MARNIERRIKTNHAARRFKLIQLDYMNWCLLTPHWEVIQRFSEHAGNGQISSLNIQCPLHWRLRAVFANHLKNVVVEVIHTHYAVFVFISIPCTYSTNNVFGKQSVLVFFFFLSGLE